MTKKTPSSETLLKDEVRSSRTKSAPQVKRSSRATPLETGSRSSNEVLFERSAPQGRRPLLKAESRSSTESNLFFNVTVDLLKNGQSIRFQAPGRSMTPTILENEAITIDPITAASVRKGDIILYSYGTGVIAHRVVHIEKKEASLPPHSFILRGDASINNDKPVARGQILGKVVSVERNGRSIALCGIWAKTKRMTRLLVSRTKRLLKRYLRIRKTEYRRQNTES